MSWTGFQGLKPIVGSPAHTARSGGTAGRVPDGEELPDLNAARERALSAARDMIKRTHTYAVRDWFACSFEIEDEDAQLLLTVPFSETVPDADYS